ncbi:MAG: glycosyltransferase family 4 protein [Thermoplasmata archaeon]|nr:glycosyltransferase family 4 protein [Thermoplasmata archaeon]
MSWKVDLLATTAPDDPTSGLSRTVYSLGESLSERGHTVRILYPSNSAPPPQGSSRVKFVPVPDAGASRRPFGRDIVIGRRASELLDPHADLFVGNDEKAGALTMPAKNGTKRPVFAMFVHDVSLHTFDTLRPLEPNRGLRQKLGNYLDRRALFKLEGTAIREAGVIVVGSELNRALLERYYHPDPSKVKLVPHGVPDPIPVGTREEARQALHVPLDVQVVSFIGRNPERQGLPVALQAFRRVRAFFPGARFLVVGSSVAAEPGVMSLGVVDERTKARVLTASDVFLFPARYEGFGLAPREAMRYGVATLVSRHVPMEGAGAKGAVRVCPGDDPGDYASELAELLAQPALRREIGESGRAYADSFSYARMAERVETALAPILSSR